MLVAVHHPGHDRVRIGARADDQKDHQEQGLEVEKGRLGKSVSTVIVVVERTPFAETANPSVPRQLASRVFLS